MDSHALAASSCAWASGPTRLVLGYPSDSALVLGAFERDSVDRLRRGSGGGTVSVGPGTLWLQLVLERMDALMPCSADKLVNRHIRPLLRALTKVTSMPAHFFGRDWVSMGHRPVAFVGFAHEAKTGRALVEAIVAVEGLCSSERPSFLGKAPGTLVEIAGKPIDRDRLLEAVAVAYGLSPVSDAPTASPLASPEPDWAATEEEAIGRVAAGRDGAGRMRVGGELMASTDAVRRLEGALASGAEIDRAVDEAFTTDGATIFGVRSLTSIRDVIVRATASSSGASSCSVEASS